MRRTIATLALLTIASPAAAQSIPPLETGDYFFNYAGIVRRSDGSDAQYNSGSSAHHADEAACVTTRANMIAGANVNAGWTLLWTTPCGKKEWHNKPPAVPQATPRSSITPSPGECASYPTPQETLRRCREHVRFHAGGR